MGGKPGRYSGRRQTGILHMQVDPNGPGFLTTCTLTQEVLLEPGTLHF